MSRYIEYISMYKHEFQKARLLWIQCRVVGRLERSRLLSSVLQAWLPTSYSGKVNHIRFANNGGSFASTEFSFSAPTARSGIDRRPPFQYEFFDFKHFQNFNTVSFKELHPLLLVSTPFQTNKINIRLSVIFIKLILLHARGKTFYYARGELLHAILQVKTLSIIANGARPFPVSTGHSREINAETITLLLLYF